MYLINLLQAEVHKLKSEVFDLKVEVKEMQEDNKARNTTPPVGQYVQLYFKEPFTIDEALDILVLCIEEGIK